MQEEFKDVEGYEGLYQISNLGNVKSLSRKMVKGKAVFISKEKILKQSIDSNGYYVVHFKKNLKSKLFKVHQLLAMGFLNHKICGYKLVVDHIDNNRNNNNLNNLQIITSRENTSKDQKNRTSKYTGVSLDKSRNKWRSNIYINDKQVYLGRFNTEQEASNAYQNKLLSLDKNEDKR